MDAHIQIATRGGSRPTLPRKPNARPLVHPCRNRDLQAARRPIRRTQFKRAPRPLIGFGQRHLDLSLNILPACRLALAKGGGATTSAPLAAWRKARMEVRLKETGEGRLPAEEVFQVLFVDGAIFITPPSETICSPACGGLLPLLARPAPVLLAIAAHLIVFPALFRVGKHFVGFINLFKAFLRCLVARIHIGMKFPRQLAISLADGFLINILAHPKDAVIIFVLDGHRRDAFNYTSRYSPSTVSGSSRGGGGVPAPSLPPGP